MSPAWRDSDDDHDDGEWDDEDAPWADDGDSDETDVASCPNCGSDVYEDAEQCPVCGDYITRSTSALSGRPGWYVLLGIAGIIATILVISAGIAVCMR